MPSDNRICASRVLQPQVQAAVSKQPMSLGSS